VSARAGAVLAACVLAIGACGGGGDGEGGPGQRPLTVAAAASLKPALEPYGQRLGARLSFAASNDLAAQIRRGLRPDVFAAADPLLPAALHVEGLVETPVPFASSELVLAVPADSEIVRLADLEDDGLRLALGAEGVPVGNYARKAIARLPGPRAEAIRASVRTLEPDAAGIVSKLAQGAVDAGFVYRTDVRAAAPRLRAITLPAHIQPEIVYAAAVVSDAHRPEEARRFVTGLADAPSVREAGFGPPP
jgi:molybdate transport system substrate-binding protein